VVELSSCCLSVLPKSDPAYTHSFHKNILLASHPEKARFSEEHYKDTISCSHPEVTETRFFFFSSS